MASWTEPSFWEDLRSALAAWARFPWLPAISVALSLLTSFLPEPLWFVGFLVSVLYVGWVGTERICYLRAFRSNPITTRELWRLTFAFVMRYATLGLVIVLPLAPIFIWATSRSMEGDSFEPAAEFLVVSWVATVAIDVCLTFVTPALAFTARRVRYALWLGVRMIRSEWPRCLWYVLVPPLAVLIVVQLLGRGGAWGVGVQLIASIMAALLNLWFKGATAAFYLRRHEPMDEMYGAALLPRFPVQAGD
jgi:hypothetical protein